MSEISKKEKVKKKKEGKKEEVGDSPGVMENSKSIGNIKNNEKNDSGKIFDVSTKPKYSTMKASSKGTKLTIVEAYKEQLLELEDKMSKKEEELTKAVFFGKNLSQKMKKSKSKLKLAKTQISELEQECKDLRSINDGMEEEVLLFKNELVDKKSDYEDLIKETKDLTNMREEKKRIMLSNKKLRLDLQKKNERIEKLDSKVSKVLGDWKLMNLRIEKFQKRIEEKEGVNIKLLEKNKTLQENLCDKTKKLINYESEIRQRKVLFESVTKRYTEEMRIKNLKVQKLEKLVLEYEEKEDDHPVGELEEVIFDNDNVFDNENETDTTTFFPVNRTGCNLCMWKIKEFFVSCCCFCCSKKKYRKF